MTILDLEHSKWTLGAALAAGGFGKVFEATNEVGESAVAKLIPKAPGAARELLFEELSGRPNVVPILDTGETESDYVLVMPRADKSLRQHLEGASAALSSEEAVLVLVDVAEALSGLEGTVVHRDLKPENVLLLGGHWCLADFGIARYAEATTSADTHKFAMTPPYAAPEQWRGERATPATDVYSFGVMAYEMISGARPFSGPASHDYREQHLTVAPAPLTGAPPTLASLVLECLYKPPEGRPTASTILQRLRIRKQPVSPAAQRLQALNQGEIERRGVANALASVEQTRETKRRELYELSKEPMRQIAAALREQALEAAPVTSATSGKVPPLRLQLGSGSLEIDKFEHAPFDCLAYGGYQAPFDVIGFTHILARKPRDRYDYEGRAHSLWFCDAHEAGVYRWYELAFMFMGAVAQRYVLNPTALPPTNEGAIGALCPYISTVNQLAWQPVAIDQGDEAAFIDRWLGWFAAAADGSLSHPRSMPENSGGRYRYPPSQRHR